MNDHETYAYFYVKGFDCDPETITDHLGLEPTETWRKGEAWGPDEQRERSESSWVVKSEISTNDYYTNVHFSEILGIVESVREKLASLPKGSRVGITYVPTCYYPNIGVVLGSDLLRRVADLGLELDFDIYSLGETK